MERVVALRVAVAFLLTISVAVLGMALALEFLFGVKPCVMCLWQRWPYVAVAVLGTATLAAGRASWLWAGLALSTLAFLTGTGIAVFHVGVEQHWWAGTASCGVPAGQPMALTLDQLRAEIMATEVVRCDVVAWSWFGISLAGYNALVSCGLFLFAAAATISLPPRRPAP